MKNNGVTLLLTLYEPSENDLHYWSHTAKILKENNLSFFVLSDNPDLNFAKYFEDQIVFESKINKGKLKLVYDFVKRNKIQTTHFKSVDPDDRISIESLLKFSEEISDDNSIIRTDNLRAERDIDSLCGVGFCSFEKLKIIEQKSYGNSWTTLPTKMIELDEYSNIPIGINWIEDQIMALICLVNGAGNLYSDNPWYVYNDYDGMTKNVHSSQIKLLERSLKVWWQIFSKNPLTNLDSTFPGDLFYLKSLFENEYSRELEKYEFNNFDFSNLGKQNVCLITDDKQIDYSLTLALNIIKSSSMVNIYIIGNDLSDGSKKSVEIFSDNIYNVNFIDFKFDKENHFKSNLESISDSANIRLFLAEILPGESEVLYLDNDIFIDGEIDDIFQYVNSFDGKMHFAAQWKNDPICISNMKIWTGNDAFQKYFNSGVFYFNLDKIREDNSIALFKDFYNKHGTYLPMVDQDILSGCLEINKLPYFYNNGSNEWEKNLIEHKLNSSLRVIHFKGAYKPWKNEQEISKILEGDYIQLFDIEQQKKYRYLWKRNYYSLIDFFKKTRNIISPLETSEYESGLISYSKKDILKLKLLTIGITFHKESVSKILKKYNEVKNIINHFEVKIVIDRKLSDDEKNILNKFIEEDDLILLKKNNGKFNAMKELAKKSDTKYIKILDPDDEINDSINHYDVYSSLFMYDEPLIFHSIEFSNFLTKKRETIHLFNKTKLYHREAMTGNYLKILPFNANVIYRINDILELEEIDNYTANSDLYLLGLLGENCNFIVNIKVPFYHYIFCSGISVTNESKYVDDKVFTFRALQKVFDKNPQIIKQSIIFYSYWWEFSNAWYGEQLKDEKIWEKMDYFLYKIYKVKNNYMWSRPNFSL